MTRTPIRPHANSREHSDGNPVERPGGDGGTSQGTPERVLHAAGRIFAENGYRNATVRQICEVAGANVAAINYHFGDKQGLYDRVLKHALSSVGEGRIGESAAQRGSQAAPPADRLRVIIHTLLSQLLHRDESTMYVRLIARELLDPTPALERLIDEGIRPPFGVLLEIVEALFGLAADRASDPAVDRAAIRRCTSSILAQCLFYCVGRPIILRLPLEDEIGLQITDELADHVTGFSLAGIRATAARAAI